jgi:hypothetical protein
MPTSVGGLKRALPAGLLKMWNGGPSGDWLETARRRRHTLKSLTSETGGKPHRRLGLLPLFPDHQDDPMTAFILDTLSYAETLKAGGFSEQQAATQARALADILDRQLATKAEMDAHDHDLRRDIELLRMELKRDIAEAKADLTRWIIGAGLLQTSLIIGVLLKVGKLI